MHIYIRYIYIYVYIYYMYIYITYIYTYITRIYILYVYIYLMYIYNVYIYILCIYIISICKYNMYIYIYIILFNGQEWWPCCSRQGHMLAIAEMYRDITACNIHASQVLPSFWIRSSILRSILVLSCAFSWSMGWLAWTACYIVLPDEAK